MTEKEMLEQAQKEMAQKLADDIINKVKESLQENLNKQVGDAMAEVVKKLDATTKDLATRVLSLSWYVQYIEDELAKKGILSADKKERDNIVVQLIQARMKEVKSAGEQNGPEIKKEQ